MNDLGLFAGCDCDRCTHWRPKDWIYVSFSYFRDNEWSKGFKALWCSFLAFFVRLTFKKCPKEVTDDSEE